MGSDSAGSVDQEDDGSPLDKDEFVVEKLIGICYGGSGRKDGIYFKVGVFLFSSCCLLLILKTSVCMHAILKNPQEQKFHNMEKVQHFKKKEIFLCIFCNTVFLQVQWAGYGPEEDTWEPIDNLRLVYDKISSYHLLCRLVFICQF